jgi:TPR repeat protein
MIHWLEYGGMRITPARENIQLAELQRYLAENPDAKAEGYWKTTGDMFAKFVRLECNRNYAELDLECDSISDKSLIRHPRKPPNIEYSKVITEKIHGKELSEERRHEQGEARAMEGNSGTEQGGNRQISDMEQDYHYEIRGADGELLEDGYAALDSAVDYAAENGGHTINKVWLPLDGNGGLDYEAEAIAAETMWERTEQQNNYEQEGGRIMNENTAPLAENQYVQELFSVMRDNGKDTAGLAALIGHVSEMESFVKRAEDRIAEMKSQLSEMKEVRNHPVKTALQNAIKTLESKVAEVKERITELKHNIVEGCKSAVEAFKEKGAAALNGIAKFFHIKGALKAVDRDMEQSIKICDKAIANINSFAAEYHSAGRAIKNLARIAVGKEPVDAKKEAGKLAKAVAAPYKAQKTALNGIKKAVDNAITALEAAEERQNERKTGRQAERADKPDMLAKIAKNKERVEQKKREAPEIERTKAVGAEL